MLSGSCGTRDEPYVPRRRADVSVLKRGLSWGHLLNIYKLKATSCGLFASGNRVPESMSGMGCSFRLRPRWETASHSDCKFRVAFSTRALNRKPHPIPKANSGTHFPRPRPSGKPVPFRPYPGTVYPPIRPSINKGAPSRTAGAKFIASSARKEGHLMWPSSCAGL